VRGLAWIAVLVGRLCLLVGGLCVLGLGASLILYISGDREFPAPFTDPPGADASLGTYAWQVGLLAVGS
jgi:hypothetical protein